MKIPPSSSLSRNFYLSLASITLSFSSLSVAQTNAVDHVSNEQAFQQCLPVLAQKMAQQGVDVNRIKQEFDALSYVPRVIELDRSQPEFISTFPDYFTKRVNDWRINKGKEALAKHKDFLRELTNQYGIPGHYLISFWGLETNFGGYKGKMSTLDSLATLACDARRANFFTKELALALKLMDEQGLDKSKMQGSWAGAMGHTQFMPSTYTSYAIDGDGDNKIDLWESEKDALASAANFLWKLGWKSGLRWGREVILPAEFDFALADKSPRPLAFWQAQGITKVNGESIGNASIDAKLLMPAGFSGPAFLVYKNFDIILRWNNSEFYGIAVGQLANQVAGGTGLATALPDLPRYSIKEMAQIQRDLNALGFDVGGADGIIGPATRAGLAAFQSSQGLIADGFPSAKTVDAIKQVLSTKNQSAVN